MMHIGHSLVAVASLVEHGLSGRGAWTAERILTHYATNEVLVMHFLKSQWHVQKSENKY